MRLFIFLLFSLSLLISACGDTSSKGKTPTTPQVTDTPAYQSIPLDRLQYLWNNATYMDVVFYDLPVAMNQSSLESIRTTLAHIAENPPVVKPECSKSIGRIFFQVDGKNVETAEIYFQQGCTYYLWLENDKPAYANEFTKAGVNFYNNIIQQVQGQ